MEAAHGIHTTPEEVGGGIGHAAGAEVGRTQLQQDQIVHGANTVGIQAAVNILEVATHIGLHLAVGGDGFEGDVAQGAKVARVPGQSQRVAADFVVGNRGIVGGPAAAAALACGFTLPVHRQGLVHGGNQAIGNARVRCRILQQQRQEAAQLRQGFNPGTAVERYRSETHDLLQGPVFIQTAFVVGIVQGQGIGGFPLQGQAPGLAVDAVKTGAATGVVIQGIALAGLVADAGRQAAETFTDFADRRQVGVQAQGALIVLADRALDPKAKLASGLAGDEIDRTGGGVATVQGTLGTSQHFDPLQFGNFHARTIHLADVDAIHVDAHGRIRGQVGATAAAKATDGQAGGTAGAGGIETKYAGHFADKVAGAIDAALLQHRLGQGGN